MRRTIDYGERGQVVVSDRPKDVGLLALEEMVLAHLHAERDQRHALIALSGGSTPKQMFEVIKTPLFQRRIAWDTVNLFWGDERWVPLDDEQSNAGEAKRGFIDDIGLSEETWHPWPTHLDSPDQAAEAYEMTLRIVSGEFTATPVFDLILLGMGDDGHTASLFPGTDALQEHERLAVANAVPKLDTTRLTFTAPLINAAREVIFLVTGAGKAPMLHEVLDGPKDVDMRPSQIVRPDDGRLRWFVDAPAAAELERG